MGKHLSVGSCSHVSLPVKDSWKKREKQNERRKMDVINQIRSMNVRELLQQVVSLAFVVCAALVIWKVVGVYANCDSPIVVVLTYV